MTRVVLGDIQKRGWGAVFSWLLSLAVLVICVISPLELPSLTTEVWGDPLLVERCGPHASLGVVERDRRILTQTPAEQVPVSHD